MQKVNAFLTSPALAIALLVIVLACCVVGVSLVRGVRAGELIFATLWFNALLVLLAISSFVAFFSRIWKRKLTLVSVGMILFHLSFAALLCGVVYNRLFYFRGVLRLTEGETLANGQVESYDYAEHGRFFDYRRLRGATTLVRMHRDYSVGGANKRAAYEIAVGEETPRPRSIIYVTEYLDHDGVRYFCSKEGYSVLLILSEKSGQEIFGAHVPLQSFRQADGSYRYATGTSTDETPFGFPPPPDRPLVDVLVGFRPSSVKDREGEVTFWTRSPGAAVAAPEGHGVPSPDPFGAHVDPLGAPHDPSGGPPNPHGAAAGARGGAHPRGASLEAGDGLPNPHGAPPGGLGGPPWREGRVFVGAPFDAGRYTLTAREIRYWVGMDVRYDPGLTAILASLCFGLAGMAVTFVGRIRQGAARKRRVEGGGPAASPAAAREENG